MKGIVVRSKAELEPYVRQIVKTRNVGATIHIRGGSNDPAMVVFDDDEGIYAFVEEGYNGGGRPYDIVTDTDPQENEEGYIKELTKNVFYGKPTRVEVRGISLAGDVGGVKRLKRHSRKKPSQSPFGIRSLR